MGPAGCCAVKLTFVSAEQITAAVDMPAGLNRKNRRILQRWVSAIFRKLDADPRGLRIVATCNGRVVSLGVEHKGKGVVLFP